MYVTAVKLAREQASQVALKSAELMIAAKVEPYSLMKLEDLVQRVMPVLELQLRYLETGDLTEWQEFCTKLALARSGQGISYLKVIEAGLYIVEAWELFFEENLPPMGTVDGLPASKVVNNLKRRLQGLHTVGMSTMTKIGVQNKLS